MTSTQFVKFLTTLPPPSHDKLLCVYAVSLNLPFCADVTIGRSLGSRRTAERKNERAREHTYTISLKFPSGIYGPTLLPPPFRTAADATQGWNGQPPRSSERARQTAHKTHENGRKNNTDGGDSYHLTLSSSVLYQVNCRRYCSCPPSTPRCILW